MDRRAEAVLDEYLVIAAQGGSREAFRRLVVLWTPRLRRHAQRVLLDSDAATDAVQDAWLAIARGLRRLRDPARFPGWAYAIASRRCADEIRRRQGRRALVRSVSALRQVEDGLAPGDPDRVLDLTAALAGLAPDQRLLVSLHYGEGLPVEDLAVAFNLPAGTVKSRLHAARRRLKLHLEGEDHDPH
ncbi:RNA polymerase sigma factor [Caulobacter sp. NIBR1757]|uniref:RNA polymerase sigma factor n=1 Tax=Caulobacter sp. NIBR1757 TaxID=3016000 RepID=UPI0022F026E6|nr:RNA polymerase sigma factor [Caulobacter sp. NIBR1757]WGM37715.1 ECF RNA polymerase sigma factor SigW [Caulobacter sp. NIBR1757]